MEEFITFAHFILGQLLVTPLWWAVGMIIGGIILVLCIWLTKDRIDTILHYRKIVEDIKVNEKKLKELKLSIFGIENREKKIDTEWKNINQAKKHLRSQQKRFDGRNAILEDSINEYNSMYSNSEQFPKINQRVENEIKAQISARERFAIALKPYVKNVDRANNYLQNQEIKLILNETFSDSPILDFVEKIYSLLIGKGVPGVVAAWLLYRSLSGLN